MQVENIRFYLAFAYSDEQLAALLAHAESGKLGYRCCCCFVGIPTAPHPLQAADVSREEMLSRVGSEHVWKARKLPFANKAESEFLHLGPTDELRRERLLPLIREEMDRRLNGGVKAFFGTWPGEETDEELLEQLAEVR